MAYADQVTVTVRLRSGDWISDGEVVKEHREWLDVGESVSLDDLYFLADDFVRALYIDDELGMHLGLDEMPTATSVSINASSVSQGGDSAGVSVVLDLLNEKAWDLWITLIGAWLYEQLKKRSGDND